MLNKGVLRFAGFSKEGNLPARSPVLRDEGRGFPTGTCLPNYGLFSKSRKEVSMDGDMPLTDLFWCPACVYRGLFHAEPTAYVKCICGRWWVIGDYEDYLSLTHEEREKIKTWDVGSVSL
jgi:hypothetical protein